MFFFSQSDTPAVRAHLTAQTAFLNDLSKSLSRSFQEMCQLNIQLGQTLLEESATVGQHLLTSERPTDLLSVTAARAQPTTEKLRAYQQHLARVAADSQVEFSKVAEQHVQETSRTARALADKVASSAGEEADRAIRFHEESLKSFRDPFEHIRTTQSNGRGHEGSVQAAGDGAHGSVSGHVDAGNEHASFRGNLQMGQNGQGQQGAKTGKSA